jgi:hypothetical protein
MILFFGGGVTYLLPQFSIDGGISVGTTDVLFQKRQQDGHNDTRLQSLPEDDEEDWRVSVGLRKKELR